ncbi:MAG: ABC transporter substrate-binding protein [Deltaproteobacteria bacterium]|nr:ABC transporter substrate-binding protein [Deltaproteobacteria bacterium]MBF0507357.1 ABC transporter substrate-binding protein [Deltaproteobacteria bacterium]MBF0527344.1 ABC transporter substrate-binding protein [Deltaproteobacteria bacterium]
MKKIFYLNLLVLSFLAAHVFGYAAYAQEPIILGVPTSTGFIEGKEALKAVNLAVEEINAKGGVKVGPVKRPLKVESIDIRDAAPGVPVPEALLGLEKIILEKKPTALLVGPFRSEALVAGMDLIIKYKVPTLATIAMSPASEDKIKKEPDKYKYIFRTCLNAKFLVKYLIGTMSFIHKEFGFNKVYIMNQDVAWARKTAELITKNYFEKAGWTVLGEESYPTGTSDFSSSLGKAREKGAQVILPIFDMPQSGILVKQWNSMKLPCLMAGFISPLTGPGAWKTFDGKIGGAINCNFELGSAIASAKVPMSKKFEEAYQKKWGASVEAGHGPAPSYESVYILAEAIERAGSVEPDAVVAELKKTDRLGVMGRIKFDEGQQVIYDLDPEKAALACVFQWTDAGGRVIVYPESIAEGKIMLPPGLKPAK